MENKKSNFQKFYKWIIENILWEALALIFSLITSGAITIFSIDFLNLNIRINGVLVFLVYFFLFFGVFRFISDIYQLFFTPDLLLGITKSRTEGVILRNSGIKAENEEDALNFIEAFEQWNERTIDRISKISESEAEYFRVINRFKLSPGTLPTKVKTHNKKFNVLEEKLKRLEVLYNEMKNSEK